MNRTRAFAWGGALVLVAGGVVLWQNRSSLDDLVRKAIERYGSETAGTEVHVSSVSISAREGRGTVRELRVENPLGFSSEDMFRLGDITLDIRVKSLVADPVVIEEVRISSPRVRYERKGAEDANLDVVQDNLERSRSGQASGSRKARRLTIRKFVLEQGEVVVDLGDVTAKPVTIALPPLELTNLGGRDGADPERICREILSAISKKAARAVAEEGLEKLAEKKLPGEAVDAVKSLVKKVYR